MKVLNIVESAYRATIEEQDDTIVWLTHAMKGAGADLALLLRGNAVSYAVARQDASGLAFGTLKQTQPAQIAADVERLLGKGVPVFILDDDIEERGIAANELIDGLTHVRRGDLAKLFGDYDQVWHW